MGPPLWLLLHLFLIVFSATGEDIGDSTSIVFTTLGRATYAFDIFSLPTSYPPEHNDEIRLTDGQSVNFNGYFPFPSSSILSLLLPDQTLTLDPTLSPPVQLLVYVTERFGISNIYLDAHFNDDSIDFNPSTRRSALESPSRIRVPLLNPKQSDDKISMKDRPSVAGEHLIYVSTHENPGVPRTSWDAVYSTNIITGETRRLTPYRIADFSPSVSPSRVWTAVASSGEKGWNGEIEELNTDIYIFRTQDGSERIKLVDHGGWPCWVDDFTLYFHRRSEDGWWSVYRASLPRSQRIRAESVAIERLTPPGLHAFTPAASPSNKSFIAVATRRPTSDFRHIELFDLGRNEFRELSRRVSPKTHHYNPFFSPDSTRVGYHRCRGSINGGASGSGPLMLENLESPLKDLSLFRIDGSFPSFSPDGERIAYVGFPGVYVVNRDGTGKRQVFPGTAFSTAWDWKRSGVIYTSVGPTFAEESTGVDIVSISIDEDEDDQTGYVPYKKMTIGGKNNAFPSASPDGKWVAFRSGRSGHKNLYVMDALEGEKGGLRRLTEGPWTDTMCNWSPDGEWIAFASDRHNPGGGSFAIYFIHPNGTGLKKVVHSSDAGRTNHPWFSPDGKSIVFTSDYAAVSGEPIANPHHYQPYGDIFTAKVDGSDLRRLTHNTYEDGTPAWGPIFIRPVDVVESPYSMPRCSFDDCHWLGQANSNEVGIMGSHPGSQPSGPGPDVIKC
ncbi:uncharacterized protein LOC122072794 [Macadamia integrifolia]|uniref:uncharacterized protein LOC122072794 n=1 Tax=Macadamia integrifolia TaxID=60698 RepID=UPI001C4F7C21|nr:uncharacterized protein LOC122072794 [Macadamia integrifolia]